MAKQVYKIPDTLDKNFADMEIPLQNKEGIGLRPLPVKQLFFYFLSIMICFWAITKTFVMSASFTHKIIFVALWGILTFVLLSKDKTNQINYELIPNIFHYLPKSARHVFVRTRQSALPFAGITNISSINEQNGLITFADGSYGYLYSVVGTGSVLLFESDRNLILDRVDSFYRKMNTDYELIFVTAKEPQKIARQVAHMESLERNLKIKNSDLLGLLQIQKKYLKQEVGSHFRSIHQYLIIKADNLEALTIGKNILQMEVESSSLMIKHCKALFENDIYNFFGLIYKGKESV